MEKESIPLFSYTPAENNNTCSDAANANDNTNCVSSSSNLSSFNLHITACSSPYTPSVNSCSRQTSNRNNHHQHHNGLNHLRGKLDGRNLFNTEHFKANKLSNLGVLLDKRLIALLVLFVSIIVFYKMVIVASKYIHMYILYFYNLNLNIVCI